MVGLCAYVDGVVCLVVVVLCLSVAVLACCYDSCCCDGGQGRCYMCLMFWAAGNFGVVLVLACFLCFGWYYCFSVLVFWYLSL